MNNYSFFTTKDWRFDSEGITARIAYKNAKMKFPEAIKHNRLKIDFGSLTKFYIKYDKNGLASLDIIKKLK
jgi:hypothetical protein